MRAGNALLRGGATTRTGLESLSSLARACLLASLFQQERSGGGLRGQTMPASGLLPPGPGRPEGNMLNFGPNLHKKTGSECTGVSGCLDPKVQVG